MATHRTDPVQRPIAVPGRRFTDPRPGRVLPPLPPSLVAWLETPLDGEAQENDDPEPRGKR